MELRRKCFGTFILTTMAAYCVQAVRTDSTHNSAVTQDTAQFGNDQGGITSWSTWSNWSPCSRTCGGGVAVQERQCLPSESNRARSIIAEGTLAPPVISVRIARQAFRADDCTGEARRYHECNTAPCVGTVKDARSQQCAAYDRRPFRGRFYTWVPYVDGDAPCTLNCRPLGQQFYASLSLVADGTPCTKPGFRAICVQGVCKERRRVVKSDTKPKVKTTTTLP